MTNQYFNDAERSILDLTLQIRDDALWTRICKHWNEI